MKLGPLGNRALGPDPTRSIKKHEVESEEGAKACLSMVERDRVNDAQELRSP